MNTTLTTISIGLVAAVCSLTAAEHRQEVVDDWVFQHWVAADGFQRQQTRSAWQ